MKQGSTQAEVPARVATVCGQAPCRQVLRVKKVAVRLGVSVPTVWRWARSLPRFPQPVPVGPGVTGFFEDEIDAFLESRREAR